ncbi:Aromatic amino acid aminotransferase [Penicillium sp. IBT 18751x]|nr:Aromatic amino acid aminotransferase [Penicillium sp. IBT 18751x]
MFHWIEIDWHKHPGVAAGKSREEIEEETFLSAVDNCVLLSRGSWFKADSEARHGEDVLPCDLRCRLFGKDRRGHLALRRVPA